MHGYGQCCYSNISDEWADKTVHQQLYWHLKYRIHGGRCWRIIEGNRGVGEGVKTRSRNELRLKLGLNLLGLDLKLWVELG